MYARLKLDSKKFNKRQLPVTSCSALVLNGELQQSVDGYTTHIECCKSLWSTDITNWCTCIVRVDPYSGHEGTDRFNQDILFLFVFEI